jgi:hypothetical protein
MTANLVVITADYMFGPSGRSTALLWPLLISAKPSEPLTGSIVPSGQLRRPPRVRTTASTPHPPHLLGYPLMAMGFVLSRKLARIPQPSMRFVFLESGFCLRLPSDPTSRWTPLPLANSFHHQDLQGTSTPKPLPMPGTRQPTSGRAGGLYCGTAQSGLSWAPPKGGKVIRTSSFGLLAGLPLPAA